jgi:hypothetical protein
VTPSRPRKPEWLAQAFAIALLATIITGIVSGLYHRPGGAARWGIGFWFGMNPDRAGLSVSLVQLLTWIHRLAIALTVLFGFASRGHVLRFEKHRLRQLFVAGSLLVTVATGVFVNWRDARPWSDPNPHAPVTELSGHEGPFLELTGVRLRYPSTAKFSRDRFEFVFGLLHFVVPLGLGLALIFMRRRTRRIDRAASLEANRDAQQASE